MVSSNDQPHGTVGKVYTEQVKLPSGRLTEMEIPVVECNRPVLFVTEGRFPPLHPRMKVQLEKIGETRTRLRWVFSSRSKSALGRIFVRILAKRNLVRRSTEGMANLKFILDGVEQKS